MMKKTIQKKYIYPKLPAKYCFPFFRIAGSGLANCLFVAARAFLRAHREKLEFIEPTWLNFSIGPYLRHQADKRHYNGLFLPYNQNHGWKKFLLLAFHRDEIEVESDLQNFFRDILADSQLVQNYLQKIIRPDLLEKVNSFDFSNAIAVHVRLGDYIPQLRIPLSWYEEMMQKIRQVAPEKKFRFLIFSDGTDAELAPLLQHADTERSFLGNALADIMAISKCQMLLGSDSTFSGWGAYLGQVPCCFLRKHYGPILQDATKEYVCEGQEKDEQSLFALLRTVLTSRAVREDLPKKNRTFFCTINSVFSQPSEDPPSL